MMKNRPSFGVLLAVVILSTTALFSQSKEPPYIEYFDCPDCEHYIVKATDPVYPSMVGFGPHKYNGLMSVQVKIDETGKATQANAVSGHPFFRSIVEKAARDISFRPQKDGGKPIGFTLVVQYQVVSSQDGEILPKPRPIINGRAISLPKPIYSDDAKLYCAGGKVEIEVKYGSDGKVLSARTISGDELLVDSSLNAAKKAIFRPFGHSGEVTFTGKLVYNFDHLSKCIDAGVVNKKAISIPKPLLGGILHPSHLRISSDTIIDVHIVVDEAGKVVSARVLAGHPLVRTEFERSALGAKFRPSLINGDPPRLKAILRYVLKATGEIEY